MDGAFFGDGDGAEIRLEHPEQLLRSRGDGVRTH
jgi:hypothetical protein